MTGVSRNEGDADGASTPDTAVETGESRGRVTPAIAHSDAVDVMPSVSSSRHEPRHGPETVEPALEKDRIVLRSIVELKYLSASQLQRFMGCPSVTTVRRSLHRLQKNGWIRLWEHWTPIGGRTKYALPQRKALAWALRVADEEACGTAAEPLARTLLTRPRRPVRFPRGATPAFLLHQVRTNDTVLALRSAATARVLWATAWDHPFPERIGSFAPPQPDAILLLEQGGAPFLLFVEMDRATQKLADFRPGKSRYAGLALRPEVLSRAFGTTAFRTIVVVQAKTEDATARRIEELRRVARTGGFAAPLTFTSFAVVQRDATTFLRDLLALPALAVG